jgi:hypothetical protein
VGDDGNEPSPPANLLPVSTAKDVGRNTVGETVATQTENDGTTTTTVAGETEPANVSSRAGSKVPGKRQDNVRSSRRQHKQTCKNQGFFFNYVLLGKNAISTF